MSFIFKLITLPFKLLGMLARLVLLPLKALRRPRRMVRRLGKRPLLLATGAGMAGYALGREQGRREAGDAPVS